MKRNRTQQMPEDEREAPITNGKYDDEDESYGPLFDEGWFEPEFGEDGE